MSSRLGHFPKLVTLVVCMFFSQATTQLLAQRAKGTEYLHPDPLVNLAKVDKTIIIELRYATDRNITGRAIYKRGTKCLVRSSVAKRLKHAQQLLRQRGYGLKIWDAWRPAYAQQILWESIRKRTYVADPSRGGSLHEWGVAVDATLVNARGREMKMPTNFDDFTEAASLHYKGVDPEIIQNMRILQWAMGRAGFYGMRYEWWHFTAKDWQDHNPLKAPIALAN
jgi:D-alanyl-D-alanine dipeptidase